MIGQSRIMLNQNIGVIINNSVYLVLTNPNTNAISTLGTGGNIISEGEFNRLKWVLGTNIGNYTVPFSKNMTNKIPLAVNITTAGVGSGSILFSTYGGSSWDNNLYKPSDVTQMAALYGGANNSAYVIDRFWIIDAVNYTTKPSPAITFNYLDAEWSAASNTISEPGLFAQRFNPTPANIWGDWLGALGTANITANTVSSGNVAPASFYRSWTLVDQISPLPIELLYFKVSCTDKNKIQIDWASATETNNQGYTVQVSNDGIYWQTIYTKPIYVNSTTTQVYQAILNKNNTKDYYRLMQTDNSGEMTYSSIVYQKCNDELQHSFNVYPNPTSGYTKISLTKMPNETVDVKLYNGIGQLIYLKKDDSNGTVFSDNLDLSQLASSVYFLTIDVSGKIYNQIIIIQK